MQKAQKTLFFPFLANFVQSVSKNVEKHCFVTLFVGTHAKSSKHTVFFLCIFANFVQSSSKNVKKHCFLTLFVGRHAKSSKHAFFSQFLRTLYKVSRKT